MLGDCNPRSAILEVTATLAVRLEHTIHATLACAPLLTVVSLLHHDGACCALVKTAHAHLCVEWSCQCRCDAPLGVPMRACEPPTSMHLPSKDSITPDGSELAPGPAMSANLNPRTFVAKTSAWGHAGHVLCVLLPISLLPHPSLATVIQTCVPRARN